MLSHDEAQELHGRIGAALENFTHMPAGYTAADARRELTPLLDRALELAAVLVSDTMEGVEPPTPSPVSHNPCLQGKVLIDGAESDFLIPLEHDSVGFSQWGAPNEVLWQRVDLLDNLSIPAREWWAEHRPDEEDGDD
jgi:hypothetical protein